GGEVGAGEDDVLRRERAVLQGQRMRLRARAAVEGDGVGELAARIVDGERTVEAGGNLDVDRCCQRGGLRRDKNGVVVEIEVAERVFAKPEIVRFLGAHVI